MRLAIHQAGVTKRATKIHVRKGGSLKTAVRAWIRQDGVLKQFYAALTVALSSYSVIGRGNSASTVPVTSAPVTADVTGAVGAVSHAWTRTAPDAQPWTINNATSAIATFTTNCDQNERFTATFIDTVTDAAGQVLASSPVTANCANIYYGGGYIGGQPPAPGSYYP
jgi:hypothetical protein